MKRYDFYGEYDYYATPVEDIDGAWIRYTDHCEAMKRIAAEPPRQMVADRSAIYDTMVQFCDGNGVGIEPEVVDELAGAVERFLQARANDAATGMVADSAGGAEPVAWHIGNPDGTINKLGAIYHNRKSAMDHFDSYGVDFNCCIVPLYAAPAPSASPAALTDEYAMRTALRIMANLEDRSGVLDGVDDDIKAEIADEIAVTILAAQPPAAAEAERDAARYRFIKASMLILSGGHRKFGWPVSPFGEQCDRYLDAAMSASKEGA